MKEIFKYKNTTIYSSKWEDRSETQGFAQKLIFPKNTYSPWQDDSEFQEVYNSIKNHTLVDIYRCYELWAISKQLSDCEGSVIEIGVWRGGTGLILAKAGSENTKVYLCDTFEGVVKASDKDNIYKGGEHQDTSLEIVNNLFSENNQENFEILKGVFPDETSQSIAHLKFKLCHIDVDVYQSAKEIFEWVWPKMVSGGIVIFDDFGFAACEGITQLVNEISELNKDAFLIYNINGHGIILKRG